MDDLKKEKENFEEMLKKFAKLQENDKFYVLGFIQAKTIDAEEKKTA